jgi:hypothetical protein
VFNPTVRDVDRSDEHLSASEFVAKLRRIPVAGVADPGLEPSAAG